jgi:hypothetical protein
MLDRRSVWLAIFCSLFIATVWLNQSVIRREWEAEERAFAAAPQPELLRMLRHPLLFLYQRSGDEEIYYFTASQILGKPYADLVPERGDVPKAFKKPLMPSDGHFHVPYREVPLEYPPLVLPLIVAPRWLADTPTGYGRVFGALIGILLVAAAGLLLPLLPRDARARSAWLLSVLLLAHGGLAIQRLDALVALLLAAALNAIVRRKPLLVGLSLGLLSAVKLVPVLLVPAFVLIDRELWRRPRAVTQAFAAFVGALCVGLGPMFLASGSAFSDMLAYHSARGLQVESVLGTLYGAFRALTGQAEPTVLNYGSFNFPGPTADVLGALCMPLSVLLLGGVASVLFGMRSARPPDPSLAAAVFAFALSLLWLSGKVFSPQYLTWVIPVALLLPWRRERLICVAFLALSQLYLRYYYDDVIEQRPLGIIIMVVRQALIVWFALACFSRIRAAKSSLPA